MMMMVINIILWPDAISDALSVLRQRGHVHSCRSCREAKLKRDIGRRALASARERPADRPSERALSGGPTLIMIDLAADKRPTLNSCSANNYRHSIASVPITDSGAAIQVDKLHLLSAKYIIF